MFPIGVDIARAGIDILTALQDDGAGPCFREGQSREQTGRTESDDDGANGRCFGKRRQDRRRIGRNQPADGRHQTRGNAAFILRAFKRNIQRDDEADVAFFSGVHAFFADFAMRDGTLRNAERFCCRLSRGFCTEIERELDIMKPKHVVSSENMG